MAEDVGWTLLGKTLFGETTEEEEARIRRWIRRDPKRKVLLGQLRKILRTTDDAPSAEDLDAEALWARIDRETREETTREETIQDDTVREEGEESASSTSDSAGTSDSSGESSQKPSRSSRPAARPRSRDASLRKAVWTGALAALVAVTAALWLLVPLEEGPQGSSDSSPEIFATQKGQRTSVRLPDGSQVRLNVDSRLVVPPTYGEPRRAVRLEGEAFFEVRPDSTRPFEVRSGGAVTRVLGTAFDIGAYPEDEEIKVVVVEGRVGLRAETPAGAQDPSRQDGASPPKDTSPREDARRPGESRAPDGSQRPDERPEVVLTKGQVSLISRSGEWAVHREEDLSEHLAWIEGELVFEDASFGEVARRLERWYDLEVTLEEGTSPEGGTSPPSGHLNARFAGDRPLADVLRVIGAAFGLKHHQDGNTVTFDTR